MDNKKEDKKQRILDASIKLFSHKGYAGTKTSEISKEAKIGIGTLFNYYPTKENLINETFLYCVEEYTNFIKSLPLPDDYESFLKEIFDNEINFALNNKTLFAFIAIYFKSPEISPEYKEKAYSYLFEYITKIIDNEINKTEFDFIRLYSMIFFDHLIATLEFIEKHQEYPIKEIKEKSFNILYNGMQMRKKYYKGNKYISVKKYD